VARGADFDVGAQSAGAGGIEEAMARVLVLKSGAAAANAGAFFAVVDAGEDVAGRVRERLSQEFGPGGGFEGVTAGEERGSLEQTLADVVAAEPTAAIAVAIYMQPATILAATRGALAGFMAGPAGPSVMLRKRPEDGDGVLVERVSSAPSGSLVLAGRAIASRVDDTEIRQTVHGSMSANDAAAWLAMVGAGKSDGYTTAMVVQVQDGKSSARAAGVPGSTGGAGPGVQLPHSPRLWVGLAAAGIVLIALVAIGAKLITRTAANSPTAPTALKGTADPSKGVVLSWSGTSGAPGYTVSIDGRKYTASKTTLTLPGLQPGKTYSWQVYADYGRDVGPVSKSSSLTIPTAWSPVKPRVVSPFNTVAATGSSTKVSLCWTYSRPATAYTLKISGGGRHFNTGSMSASQLKSSKGGATCYSLSLPSGNRFSWRVGAVERGYHTSWTGWKHFQIAPAATPTPATFVPSGTPTPLPTIG
jgi:hypothetical protein